MIVNKLYIFLIIVYFPFVFWGCGNPDNSIGMFQDVSIKDVIKSDDVRKEFVFLNKANVFITKTNRNRFYLIYSDASGLLEKLNDTSKYDALKNIQVNRNEAFDFTSEEMFGKINKTLFPIQYNQPYDIYQTKNVFKIDATYMVRKNMVLSYIRESLY